MDRSLLSGLADTPAPPSATKSLVASWVDCFDRLFPILLRAILAGEAITVARLFVEGDFEDLGYRNANALGTRLGQGVGGSGLKLHRTEKGEIAAVQENAVRLVQQATDQQVADFLEADRLDEESLVEQIQQLSTAT